MRLSTFVNLLLRFFENGCIYLKTILIESIDHGQKMRALIDKYCILCFWHFTDKSNLDSIRRHGGLFSLRELENRGIVIPVPGGNEWSHDADKAKGLDTYVHLAFCNSHPMLYRAIEDERITDPIWLRIDKSVIMGPKVQFTADVSNKSGVSVLDHDGAKQNIDFEVLYTRMDWKNPEIQKRRQTAEKAEILVPNIVPLNNILNL